MLQILASYFTAVGWERKNEKICQREKEKGYKNKICCSLGGQKDEFYHLAKHSAQQKYFHPLCAHVSDGSMTVIGVFQGR